MCIEWTISSLSKCANRRCQLLYIDCNTPHFNEMKVEQCHQNRIKFTHFDEMREHDRTHSQQLLHFSIFCVHLMHSLIILMYTFWDVCNAQVHFTQLLEFSEMLLTWYSTLMSCQQNVCYLNFMHTFLFTFFSIIFLSFFYQIAHTMCIFMRYTINTEQIKRSLSFFIKLGSDYVRYLMVFFNLI